MKTAVCAAVVLAGLAGLVALLVAVRAPMPARVDTARAAEPAAARMTTADDFVRAGDTRTPGGEPMGSASRSADLPAPGLPAWSEPLATMPSTRPAVIEAAVAARRTATAPAAAQ